MLYETLALAFWMLEAMNDFLSAFCFEGRPPALS